MSRFGIICAAVLITLVVSGCPFGPRQFEFELTFTSNVSDAAPVDTLSTISLAEFDGQPLYAHVHWLNLRTRSYEYESQWIAPDGTVMQTGTMEFRPDDPTWSTWSWLTVDRNEHQAGEWTFAVRLNGDPKAAAGTLDVQE